MTRHAGLTPRRLLYGALTGGVLVADAMAPLGVNVPIVYLVPLLLAFLSEHVRTRTLLTLAASALTVLGMAWPWKWDDAWMYGALNRSFDLGVFWVALALSIRDGRTIRELRDLRTALDTASILSIVDADGIIRHVNDRFCAISKYSREELIGRPHPIVSSDSHPKAFMADLWAAIGAGQIWHGEVHDRAKDGTTYWVDSTIVPFLDDRGRPYQFLAIQHDISEQKQAEARLRSQAALAKIAEMAAVVAHEVRNPLAGVRAGLQLFERGPSISTDQRRLIGQMVDRLDLLNAHVSALVHFARPRSPQLRQVAIRQLLNDAVASVRETPTCSAVRVELVGANPCVLGDAPMLHEVFTQLLVNAAEAQGGTGTVVVTIAEGGNSVNVLIADRGQGIPAALRERIFEPLFTTKRDGTGLGLPIAKQLVDLHGGQIEIVDSSPSGTTVRVGLVRGVGGAQAA